MNYLVITIFLFIFVSKLITNNILYTMNILKIIAFNLIAILFVWSLGMGVLMVVTFNAIGLLLILIAYISYNVANTLYYKGKKSVKRLYPIYDYRYKKLIENN